MKLMIERPFVEAMVELWPELSPLREQLRFGDRAEVPVAQLSAEQCSHLGGLFRDGGPELQLRAAQLATLRSVMDAGGARFAGNALEDFLPALLAYLLADGIRGWVFSADVSRRPLPYVVTRIDYTPVTNEESGKIFLELKANAKGSLVTNVIRITASDVDERTVGEVFIAKGFLRETPELIAAYDATAAHYFDWRGRYGEQFSGLGRAFYAEDPSSSRRDTDWARKDVVVLSASGGTARLVNDEGILSERALTLEAPGEIMASYLRRAAKSNQFDREDEVKALAAAIPPNLFTAIPIHAFILMFHLDLHHYVWVHVDDMAPYAYQPALKQKLVLPPEQTDLIDILTAEMDVLMDDIVEGKSGGTTVLCAGPAGVGKTLTAEVYSEIIRRPLYRVHSGQLGLNVAQMETALKDVLTRAQRWGAVMLIDEADVYIKRREDDMTMNAVVGVFLRVLEYFNGLLFLTTNRVDDIDEAIVSRCIALIKYQAPDTAGRRRIWQVMVDQFSVAVDDALLDQLSEIFPHATGRDIKGLTKLVAKYCSHKAVAPSLEAFQRCSIFRGMDVASAAA